MIGHRFYKYLGHAGETTTIELAKCVNLKMNAKNIVDDFISNKCGITGS